MTDWLPNAKDRRLRGSAVRLAGGNLEMAAARLRLQARLVETGDKILHRGDAEGYVERRRRVAAALDQEAVAAAVEAAGPAMGREGCNE